MGFPPDRIGGTEVYVAELSGELAALGIGSTILAPESEDGRQISGHLGFPVETYPVNAVATAEEMRGNRPHSQFEAFRAILARHPGAIYHQHSWTRGCGGHHLHAAHELGLPTVLTMHVPGNLCIRGDMVRFGGNGCDGLIQPRTCAACWSHAKGAPRPIAHALANIPAPLSRAARRGGGRLATAFSARALAEDKRLAAHRMTQDSDHIVAVAGWVHDALLANGAPALKTTLSRQGVSRQFLKDVATLASPRPTGDTLKLLYLGSWNPLKGVDVLVRALISLPPDVPVRLGIQAPAGSGASDQAYEQHVRKIASDDDRVVFHGPVDRASLAATMSRYDVLAVPSVWMETGPLVVMEAQAAGLFVLGSRLGGIAENVSEDAGLLVEPGDVAAWAGALRVLSERRRKGSLTRDSRAVRSMASVAEEMAAIYRRLAG